MGKTLRLARLYLFAPSAAADEASKEENLPLNLGLYLAFAAATMLFFAVKPFDFPDASAVDSLGSSGLWFWFKVLLFQPPLEAAWIVCLMGLVSWLRGGGLPVRLAVAVGWTASPFILMAAYSSSSLGMGKLLFAALSLLWAAAFYPMLRGLTRQDWLPLVSFMLGLNVIGLALLVPMTGAVLLRSTGVFTTVQALGGLWMLGVGTLGLRRLTGLRLPRAFMAVLFSMFFQIAVAFTLHLLGVVPKEILKALLYA